jgi:hypothetical protein
VNSPASHRLRGSPVGTSQAVGVDRAWRAVAEVLAKDAPARLPLQEGLLRMWKDQARVIRYLANNCRKGIFAG